MTFLKKVSVNDLIRKEPDITAVDDDILDHYREFELFLTQSDLKNTDEWKEDVTEKLKGKGNIVAVHCPESNFKTSADTERSSNYLSLIEAIKDKSSLEHLRSVIELAKFLSENSSASGGNTPDNAPDAENESDYSNADTFSKEKSSNEIFVIIHAGSLKGCGKDFNEEVSDEELECFLSEIADCLGGSGVQLLVENVTPYYTEKGNNGDNGIGGNSGWGDRYFDDLSDKGLVGRFNKFIKDKNKETTAQAAEKTQGETHAPDSKKLLAVGVCLDFCHLIADCKLRHIDQITGYIESSVEKCADNIKLFHLSNLGEDLSHGALFSDNAEDTAIVETILKICRSHANAPITLEMADGADKRKACENFNKMVFRLSAIHKTGVLSEALAYEGGELKSFFENMYTLFVTPWENRDLLRRSAFAVKKFMLDNGNGKNEETLPFGFTRDSGREDLALLRVKAFTFYTRFAMLGEYLAGVYKQSGILTDWKEDFSDSMKYFIFADEDVRMCVYTGVAYSFMIDMLPKRTTFYRLYDGINDTDIKKEVKYDIPLLFERIRNQINGDHPLKMYSCGKNLHTCMLKYGDVSKDWSLRVYEDEPINYIRLTGEGKTISVPAFLYHYWYKGDIIPSYNFNIDVSNFRNGREDENGGSLSILMKTLTPFNKDIAKLKVGSIADGEIVSNELPEPSFEYRFTHSLDIHVLDNYIRKYVNNKKDREYPDITKMKIEKYDINGEPISILAGYGDAEKSDDQRALENNIPMYNRIISEVFKKHEIIRHKDVTEKVTHYKGNTLPKVEVTFNEGENRK